MVWRVRSTRIGVAAVGWLIVACAVGLNVLRGITTEVSGMAWGFWALTYRHGFVRRGLVGTVFQAFAHGLSLATQQRAVWTMHYALLAALALGFLAWGRHVARARAFRAGDRPTALFVTGVAAVFLSMFFPTLAMVPDYLDVWTIALAALAAFFAFRKRPAIAGAIASVGPALHDAFLFLWLPVLCLTVADILASSDRRTAARHAAALALPIGVEVIVACAHSSHALAESAAELPEAWRGIRMFDLPVHRAVEAMRDGFLENPWQFVLALLFYGWPSVIAICCAVALAPDRRRGVAAVVATLAPCAILAIAWDLSRFLVWSAFGAFLALCWCARAALPSPSCSTRIVWSTRAAFVALVLMGIGGPGTYSYFNYTFANYLVGPEWLKHTPGAWVRYAWLRQYNHRFAVHSVSPIDHCQLAGRGATVDDHCAADLATDSYVESTLLTFERGAYTARIEVEPRAECADATGELAVHLRWRLSSPKPSVAFDARASRVVTLDFTIDAEEEAMGSVRVDVTTHAGCLRVVSLGVSPRE